MGSLGVRDISLRCPLYMFDFMIALLFYALLLNVHTLFLLCVYFMQYALAEMTK